MKMNDFEPPADTIEFAGFDNSPSISKQELQGKRLWNMLFERNSDFGGFFVELSGIMGSGKTSLQLRMARRVMKENPKELVYWSEPLSNPFQASKIGDGFQILCERRMPVKVLEITNNLQPVDDIKIRYFDGFKKLIRMSEPGLLNVIYFKDLYRWIDFLIRVKLNPEWQTFFFDEFEDVCPFRCRGKVWQKNELFASSIKEIRKSKVSVIYNTQNTMDVDYRVRSKLMVHLYLFGSRGDDLSPVFKKALQGLEVGQGWIDYGFALFGLLNFKPLLPKDKIYTVVPIDKRGAKFS